MTGHTPSLYIATDYAQWALDQEASELSRITSRLGIFTKIGRSTVIGVNRNVYHTSFFEINKKRTFWFGHKLAFDYFHGTDTTNPIFQKTHNNLMRYHMKISRIRTTNQDMAQIILKSGITKGKVKIIPLAVSDFFFAGRDTQKIENIQAKVNIPSNAKVIASFQKDGEGWGAGLNPKLIKGPDIFLKVVGALVKEIPNIFVLLTGPSRGYVIEGLKKLGIAHHHSYLTEYREISNYYGLADLYLITSRDEGGPKSFLESLACGVPVVSTKVGQIKDLGTHGKNCMLSEIDDVDTLVKNCIQVLHDQDLKKRIQHEGLTLAKANVYDKQIELWKDFFKGYVLD